MTEAIVRVAPGDGLIARRGQTLLFMPGAGPSHPADLLRAFEQATTGRFDAVTRFADGAGGETAPFVVVDWSSSIRVAVCGDVEISSDHRSLPRLSASGAGTWIERSLRDIDGAVTIGTARDDVDEITDLRVGTVRAGGFAVTCTVTSDSAATEPPARSLARDGSPVEGAPEAHPMDDRASPVTPVTRIDEAADRVSGGAAEPWYAAGPDDITIVPPDERDEVANALAHQRSSGVTSQSGAPPTANDPIVTRWRLIFTDGAIEEVDRNLVLGRKPALRDDESDATTRVVQVDCAQVSGRHLAVEPAGQAITVTDLGSRNGSFALTTGDGQLVQLEPSVPRRVDEGTVIQIGTKRFRVELVEDDPPTVEHAHG